MGHNFVDLSGQKFGYLSVIKRIENRISAAGYSRVQYLCKCDCGREVNVDAAQLRKGHKKSCSQCKLSRGFKDLTGLVFDELTVLQQDGYYEYPNGERDYKWRCVCTCGNEIITRGNSLKAKGNHNCGCYRSKLRISDKEMIGKRFGKLSVIERGENLVSSTGSVVNQWLCSCDCGVTLLIRGASLRNGHTASCGCHRWDMLASSDTYISKSEQYVIDFLEAQGYSFEREQSYPGLIGVGGNLLAYDFCIHLVDGRRVLVECHGLQHYEPVAFFGGKKRFGIQRIHDARKRSYAKTHNIPLLEINCVSNDSVKIQSALKSFLHEII